MSRRLVAGAPMCGRRVELVRVLPEHTVALHEIVRSEAMAASWPLKGQDVPVELLPAYLAQLASIQFTILRRDTGAPIGLVQGIDEDPRSRTIGLGLAVDPALWAAGWPLEGVVLFLEYLFTGLDFRKVYCSMPASVLHRTGGALGLHLTEEGRHRRHVRRGDDWEDLHLLALHRERWDSAVARRITGNTCPSG